MNKLFFLEADEEQWIIRTTGPRTPRPSVILFFIKTYRKKETFSLRNKL